MKPVRVSSSSTLFLKIFLPTVWIVFFGAFTLFIIFGAGRNFPDIPGIRIGAVLFYAAGLLLLYFTLLRLKRVEMDDDHVYVTNYFKTYRYTFQSVTRIQEIDMLLLTLVILTLAEKGAFGRKIAFVRRKKVWNEFIASHPEQLSHTLGKDDEG